MGVGLRRRGHGGHRRRAEARARRRHHRVYHNYRTRHRIGHHFRIGNRVIIFGNGQQTSSQTLNTSGSGQNSGNRFDGFLCGFRLGFILCITPGTFLIWIGYFLELGGSGTKIAGPILLVLGSTLILSSAVIGFRKDWKGNTPNSTSWNQRIRNDFLILDIIFELMGLVLACVGFNYNIFVFIITGCSFFGFGLLLLVFGLLLSRYGSFEEDDELNSTDNPSAANTSSSVPTSEPGTGSLPIYSALFSINHYPDPTPNHALNPDIEESEETTLPNDFDVIGWALFVPGICFSCIGWIKGYDDPYRLRCGLIGTVCLTTAGLLLIISTITHLCSDSTQNRGALYRIFGMCFVCGIIMTAVGFTHHPYGFALGVAGACLLGIALLTCICNRPTCQEQSPDDAELGQTNACLLGIAVLTCICPTWQEQSPDDAELGQKTISGANPFTSLFTSNVTHNARQTTSVTFNTQNAHATPSGANRFRATLFNISNTQNTSQTIQEQSPGDAELGQTTFNTQNANVTPSGANRFATLFNIFNTQNTSQTIQEQSPGDAELGQTTFNTQNANVTPSGANRFATLFNIFNTQNTSQTIQEQSPGDAELGQTTFNAQNANVTPSGANRFATLFNIFNTQNTSQTIQEQSPGDAELGQTTFNTQNANVTPLGANPFATLFNTQNTSQTIQEQSPGGAELGQTTFITQNTNVTPSGANPFATLFNTQNTSQTFQEESPGDAELGQITFNTQNANIATISGANPFTSLVTSNVTHNAGQTSVTFNTRNANVTPSGANLLSSNPTHSTHPAYPPTFTQPTGDLPSYAQAVSMPTPEFQPGLLRNTPSAPSAADYNPSFIAAPGDVGDVTEEDLPPPPSYDEVTTGAFNVIVTTSF
ncbi:uncharacterized protein [Amphiura filiformis]|uniref:uncharacterized protein n=1 Tax=Amphiura filiformis TaxID=82378 RepID=UPI003B21AE09